MSSKRESVPRSSDGPAQFTTTHWSVVLAAGHDSAPGKEAALEKLCRAYWYPPAVVTLLRRCLEKEPRRRLSSMGDIAITLEETTQISRESSRVRGTEPDRSAGLRPGGKSVPGAETGAPVGGERRLRHWLRPEFAGLVLGILVATAVF